MGWMRRCYAGGRDNLGTPQSGLESANRESSGWASRIVQRKELKQPVVLFWRGV